MIMLSKAGRILVYVREPGDCGAVLAHEGSFSREVEDSGAMDIVDLPEMPRPPRTGLLAFEGWVHIGSGPDPDVRFCGQWRELTFWEICQLRCGDNPFARSRTGNGA